MGDKKLPFPPRRWGEKLPEESGWYWFVGTISGQWTMRYLLPTVVRVRVDPDNLPNRHRVIHMHEYQEFRNSPLYECSGRWWGPIKPPGKWRR